ncbi:wall-associated receptor kinase-like 8 [Corylus avellana]|uniref:wall-associated receptor kinase-like 8 n=1 Tax=Corylus avellana TaxID=13451 RepID=UPI001E2000CF|nr:wall-associated receptor kinase-like 8 [Corylus avellana]
MGVCGKLLQIMVPGVIIFAVVSAATNAKPGCPNRCGGVEIPYPFGLTEACYLDVSFNITCDDSGIPKTGILNVTSISIETHELHILNSVARDCYNRFGGVLYKGWFSVRTGQYTISNTKNKIIVLGCDTYAYLSGLQNGEWYSIGCSSRCPSLNNVVNGSCSGVGCCEVGFPDGLKDIEVKVTSFKNHTKVWNFNPCGYAFVVEKGEFNFSSSYLKNFHLPNKTVPLVLDWAVGDEKCKEARNKPNFACQENSECFDPQNRRGYRCKCKQGYQGNPYLHGGCQDIDECRDSKLNNCTKICINIEGNYTCACPKGYHGDGRKDGEGCAADPVQQANKIPIGISSVLGLLVLLVGGWWSYKVIKKRRMIKQKNKFFKRNGGLLLQQQLSSHEANVENTKLFNSKDLEKATDRFNINRILGQGGQGTVYKGMLADGRIVAVKKSKVIDEGKLKEFINEVVILSQINHRNVVKLIGCCLETEVPLLVYEYVPNGTLSQYVNGQNEEFPLTWDMRLRIATEVAGALFYLHSVASIPIYHRDIKSTNILLDNKYRAKVADFGTSRSITIDQTHLTTLVHGTFGYLDPEYFQSSQFTEKSDVYSFGVVLAELLTGEKVISSTRTQESKSLAAYFIQSVEENNLFDIIDSRVLKEGKKEEIIVVANLVIRCLDLNRKKRPTMREVAMELEGVRMLQNTPKLQQNYEEYEYVEEGMYKPWDASTSSTMSALSIDTQPLVSFQTV